MGLERVRVALARLGNPERRFPAIQVAGTNGKGSTCAIIASCLQTRYRTGLYTSPHLVRPNERIQINGVEIDDATLGTRIADVLAVLGVDHHLTYFEFGTVLAFWHFAAEAVDIAVLETGLGGRLDATTACMPLVTCLTPIDFDHQEYLGTTLKEIAREKVAITKPQVPMVCSQQRPEAWEVIESKVSGTLWREGRDFGFEPQADGSLTFWGEGVKHSNLRLSLKGPHQFQNMAVALAALHALKRFSLDEKQLREGVRRARWPGRLELFDGVPQVLLDGAHNPAGVNALIRALDSEYPGKRVHLVFGVFEDKDSAPMMRSLFPRVEAVHLTPLASPRSKDPHSYFEYAKTLNPEVQVYPDAQAALRAAKQLASPEAMIVVAGSLFLIGQLRQVLVAGCVDTAASTVNLLKP